MRAHSQRRVRQSGDVWQCIDSLIQRRHIRESNQTRIGHNDRIKHDVAYVHRVRADTESKIELFDELFYLDDWYTIGVELERTLKKLLLPILSELSIMINKSSTSHGPTAICAQCAHARTYTA